MENFFQSCDQRVAQITYLWFHSQMNSVGSVDSLPALAEFADNVAAECGRPWLVGHELAKRLTENDRSMTPSEVALVRAMEMSVDWSSEPADDYRRWWIDEGTETHQAWPEVWAAVVQHAQNAVVVAQLSDLLWTVRHPTPHLHARRAIDAYLQSAAQFTQPHDAIRALRRAWVLARSINDQVLAVSVQQLMVDSVEIALANENYGLAMTVLEDLSASPSGAKAHQYFQLLDRMWNITDRPDLSERAAKLLLGRTNDPDTRTMIATRVVEEYRTSARTHEGMGRLVRLREALRVADELGHPLHDEILNEIETYDSTGGFQPIRSESVVPREMVSDFCARVVGSDSLDDALIRFATQLPITPDIVGDIRKTTRIGIRHAIISQRIGEANSVVTSTETSHDLEDPLVAAVERDVLRTAGFQAQLRSFLLLVPALHQTLDSYHPWSVPDVRASLVTGEADEVVADALARGLEHFRNRRYDEAALVSLPRVERLLRHIARRCGVPTTKRPTRQRLGGIRGLGDILFDLRGNARSGPILTEPLLTACELALVHPDSLNLRNDILHGISDEIRAGDAALILQIGLSLALNIRLGPAETAVILSAPD